MTVYVINNFIHLLTAVIWIGGMIYTNLVFMPSLSLIEPSQRGVMIGAVAKRFTIVSWTSIFVLLISGFFKTPDEMLFTTSNSYGLMITVKHILFLVMILSGSLITFKYAPLLRTKAPKAGEKPSDEFINAQKNLKILSSINMILGIIVLLAVSLY
jgi:putative copper resistance protein D